MPNPIKEFFEKKKAQAKFKVAGPGQKLGDAASAERDSDRRRAGADAAARHRASGHAQAGSSRSAAQQQAASAALARFTPSDGGATSSSEMERRRYQAKIQAMAKKELEEEKKVTGEAAKLRDTYAEKPVVELDAPPVCPGIFFRCDLVGPEVLPKKEMKERIREFLYSQLEEEKGLTACLIIRTMAKNEERAQVCADTLCKYLENITQNPDDEKYRKIRKSNKAYAERVASVEGHDLFLDAVGFDTQAIDDQEFWVFPGEVSPSQVEHIQSLRDALVSCEPIKAELDRGLKVLLPSQASQKFSLPPDFFSVSIDEIRREQQLKSEALEREGMLRTKAMRDREHEREKRKYRYTLIRIRFPDGLVLQGTFSVHERYRSVHDFVADNLEFVLPFVLYAAGAGSQRLEMGDYDVPLVDLGLVPSAVMTFAWHPEVAEEVSQQMGANPRFLKPEICALASHA